MTGTRAALRYAKAILDVSNANSKAEEVNDDMKQIFSTIAESNELKTFLENPTIKGENKVAALKEIFTTASEDTQKLFALLLQNNRIELLLPIASQYTALYDELKGKQIAYITTATPLTPALESKVMAKVKELSNKEVTIVNEIDPSIIGGFIIRINDQQYNASLLNQLTKLKREFNN